jgi:hypothetical protein
MNLIAARISANFHLTLPIYDYIRQSNYRRVVKEEERVPVTEYSERRAEVMNMQVRQV